MRGLRGEDLSQLEAVAGKVEGRAVDALLQDSAGIEGLADGLGVAGERVLLLQLEAGRETPEPVHLVAHLGGGGLRRPAQPGIERAHPGEQRVKLRVKSIACGRQLALALDRHGARREQLRERVLIPGENSVEPQFVAAQQVGNWQLDERGGKAGSGRRPARQNPVIEDRGLGKVSNLRRAGDDQ